MALGDVNFIKAASSLGTPAVGNDYISGIVFYNGAPYSGTKKFFSLADAEAQGINLSYSDETKAKGTIKIDTAGDEDDTITAIAYSPLTLNKYEFTSIQLGTYTVQLGDDENDIATGLNAAINALTYKHGFSSTVATDTVTITAKKGLGLMPQTIGGFFQNWVVSPLGSLSTTITQGTIAGVPSKIAVMHYHISEFFRANPTGVLYCGVFPVPVTFDGEEIKDVQSFANGEVKQMAVYYPNDTFATAQIQALQDRYDELYVLHKPCEIFFTADYESGTLSTLPDLTTLDSENVHMVIGQDGAAVGDFLFWTSGYSISCIGNTLGNTSAAKVSVNIGWRALFPNSNGTELEVIRFINGDNYTDTPQSLLNILDDYHYMFLVKNVGISGSFYNDTWSATLSTSDYNKSERNRTIDKAIRLVRVVLLPSLNAPIYVNADGTLTTSVIEYFKAIASQPLADMQNNGEIGAPPNPSGGGLPAAGYEVIINSAQDIITTNKLILTIKLIPVGLAKFIEVNIGFTVKIG